MAKRRKEKAKGIKNEAGAEFISGFEIPLPLKDIQKEIITQIAKQKNIINSVGTIEQSYSIDSVLNGSENLVSFGRGG